MPIGHFYIVLAAVPEGGRESRARLLEDSKTTMEAGVTRPRRLLEQRLRLATIGYDCLVRDDVRYRLCYKQRRLYYYYMGAADPVATLSVGAVSAASRPSPGVAYRRILKSFVVSVIDVRFPIATII